MVTLLLLAFLLFLIASNRLGLYASLATGVPANTGGASGSW